jgi:hypothetical protein
MVGNLKYRFYWFLAHFRSTSALSGLGKCMMTKRTFFPEEKEEVKHNPPPVFDPKERLDSVGGCRSKSMFSIIVLDASVLVVDIIIEQTENGTNGFRQQTEQKRTKRCGGMRFFLWTEAHLVLCIGANSRPNGFRQQTEQKRTNTNKRI